MNPADFLPKPDPKALTCPIGPVKSTFQSVIMSAATSGAHAFAYLCPQCSNTHLWIGDLIHINGTFTTLTAKQAEALAQQLLNPQPLDSMELSK